MPSRRRLLAGLGAAGLAATAGCTGIADGTFSRGTDTDTDWPMGRHDTLNTAYAPDAAAPRDGPTERWTHGGGFDARTPAVVGDTAYVPTAEALVALDTGDGSERWRFAPESQPWPAPPVVHDGRVFVTMRDEDTVHAVDAASGEALWTDDADRHVHAAAGLLAGRVVNEPAVLVGDGNGRVRALEPGTGDERWELDVFGGVRAFAHRFQRLYVGTTSGEVYVFHADGEGDGDEPRELWRGEVGGRVEGIVPTSNGIAVASFGEPLANLESDNAGEPMWTADRERAGSVPAYAGSWLLSTGYDAVSATRTYDGRRGWRAAAPLGSAPPVAAGDTLYAAGETSVHAFALDGGGPLSGAKRWSYPVPGGGVQGLAVADGALFVARQAAGGNETTLYCLEPN
ncbi:PQQ-binding-like beta-propeller repeat protein [Halosegnis marinus]|uniref:PQQ-binding-like beta-propeller repeat protein n=1 Tax=Halosegnis marinus TaxID=3034023 RepID=A0ABD5ZLJ9_9EURY|nr:PQQ-binding-like beta-propeller repeat protein [Halosegnis sp. DT85]